MLHVVNLWICACVVVGGFFFFRKERFSYTRTSCLVMNCERMTGLGKQTEETTSTTYTCMPHMKNTSSDMDLS